MDLLVLDRFDVGPAAEGRWLDWYRAERLPRWRALGGFAAAQGYRRLEGGGPSHLALIACGTIRGRRRPCRPWCGAGTGRRAPRRAWAMPWECEPEEENPRRARGPRDEPRGRMR